MKKVFLSLLFFIISSFIFADIAINPNNKFYSDAKNWETKGIITNIPQLRPYPVKVIKSILNTVIENGEEKDSKLAQFYLDKYFSKSFNFSVEIGDNAKISNDDTKNMFFIHPEIFGSVGLVQFLDFNYKLGILAQNKSVKEREILPEYIYSAKNIYNDPVTIGPMEANLDMLTNLSIGNEKMYGLFGIYKVGYGPFIGDSVMLNGSQFHSGNFSFVYNAEKWSYSKLVSALCHSIKNGNDKFSEFKPEKFLGFHSLKFSPIKQFSVSYFEAAVFSNRFDPCYFLPVPYMVLQGMYGASDNAVNGLIFEYKPFDRLAISSTFSFDDVDVNGLAKGDFNTRLKVAMQIGANYVPKTSFVNNLALDYTLITPYTYSHSHPQMEFDPLNPSDIADHYNIDNYSTQRTNLGTRLPPNSDRIQFKGSFTPVDRLKIDIETAFIRHANIAESFTDQEAMDYINANKELGEDRFSTDGSIWTSPMTDPSSTRNNFLAQDHKMYVFQLGFDLEYELERHKWGGLLLNFGYMFEYIYNKGVDSNIYTLSQSNPTEAKEKWVANFHNVVNNYMTISLKYIY